jgi:hypothetical protein
MRGGACMLAPGAGLSGSSPDVDARCDMAHESPACLRGVETPEPDRRLKTEHPGAWRQADRETGRQAALTDDGCGGSADCRKLSAPGATTPASGRVPRPRTGSCPRPRTSASRGLGTGSPAQPRGPGCVLVRVTAGLSGLDDMTEFVRRDGQEKGPMHAFAFWADLIVLPLPAMPCVQSPLVLIT